MFFEEILIWQWYDWMAFRIYVC